MYEVTPVLPTGNGVLGQGQSTPAQQSLTDPFLPESAILSQFVSQQVPGGWETEDLSGNERFWTE